MVYRGILDYAQNLQEVGVGYFFWGVRASVRPSTTLFDASLNFRTMHASVLKFLKWIPHEKIAENFILLVLTGLCPFPEIWPFEKIWSKKRKKKKKNTIEARALNLDE